MKKLSLAILGIIVCISNVNAASRGGRTDAAHNRVGMKTQQVIKGNAVENKAAALTMSPGSAPFGYGGQNNNCGPNMPCNNGNPNWNNNNNCGPNMPNCNHNNNCGPNMPCHNGQNTIDNEAEYLRLVQLRDELKAQSEELDKNIKQCEKAKKGWVAATIVGGVGVVGTGIGAAVQAKQIKNNKAEIAEMKEEVSDLNKELKSVKTAVATEQANAPTEIK